MGGDAIPAGMKRWDGGDAAPVDWDGGPVMSRAHGMYMPDVLNNGRWHRRRRYGALFCNVEEGCDIIAYTPKSDAKPNDGDRDAAVVEAMARAMWDTIPDKYDTWDVVSDDSCLGDFWRSRARVAFVAYRAHQESF